ncbi:MAG: hypothetical protein M3068_02065 [Gemmatimonadota bacterium]|nr:hypothetical protein [Gemmatimonadota bacterium]
MHRSLLFLALIAAADARPSTLRAQILRVGKRQSPSLWVSGQVGYLTPGRVYDGSTNSVWDFAGGAQYRGGIELPIPNAATLGVTGSWSTQAMTYSSLSGGVTGFDAINAHATIWSVMGVFHAGGGTGLHQVLDVSAGVVGYRKFTRDDGGTPLAPLGGDTDFGFGIGYGIGYSTSERNEIILVQDYGLVLHQHAGLPGGVSTRSDQKVTRIGLRVGVGTRSSY